MIDFAWDNDVLIKLATYDLGTDLLGARRDRRPDHDQLVLGTARWVGPSALARRISKGDAPEQALERFAALLATMSAVEPTDQELKLATDLEELALNLDLPLDGGESLLAAVCVSRSARLLTGDKRAIRAIDAMANIDARLLPILGQVYCLEQAIMSLAHLLSGAVVRLRICIWPNIDGALRLAMECSSEGAEFREDGLLSFIAQLQLSAPRALGPEHELPY